MHATSAPSVQLRYALKIILLLGMNNSAYWPKLKWSRNFCRLLFGTLRNNRSRKCKSEMVAALGNPVALLTQLKKSSLVKMQYTDNNHDLVWQLDDFSYTK